MSENVIPVESGMFNNPIIAIIALFVALALLRGDFWGNGNNGNFNQVTNDFLYTNLSSAVNQGFNNLTSQNFQIDKDVLHLATTRNVYLINFAKWKAVQKMKQSTACVPTCKQHRTQSTMLIRQTS